mmetsp:Transcript_23323/g.41238  ORF Transcript_23323/g.41238 Transcript_23323/m.41238 type:complete len:121 (-) Transcript_23323:284-646(-)|eukprot:CAMPEP_0184522282 /NCGR_PEP_ID=MMETSP0198_2-20121128/8198_1 /TAXON_ID=1112570 /ORGANISM="Thraustochytrium sp., Strain LLF1b" /LENGTH=120 /DNA_ID=CAMNT_0026913097 /DNA_START=132 /DNA_END=494 /DNA_ORIENTATION=+
MDPVTFEAALGKFKVVRSRDYQGPGCKRWEAAEAQAFREKTKQQAAEQEIAEQKRHAARRHQGEVDNTKNSAFFAALEEELKEAGYDNVPEILRELSTTLEERIYTYNIEQLEELLEKIA